MKKLFIYTVLLIGLLGISPQQSTAQEATPFPPTGEIPPRSTPTAGATLQPPSFDFHFTGLALKIKSKFNGTTHWRYISDTSDIDTYLRMFYVNEFEYQDGLEFVTDPSNQQVGTCIKVKLGTLSNKNIKVFLYVIHCDRAMQ